MHKDISDMLQRKKVEDEIEMARKHELIMQIRELEKIPIVRTKGFDPTEAGGFGLLQEMSIAELRERLEFNKREREQDTENKRQQNLSAKDRANQDLISTATKIEDARQKRKDENDRKRDEKNRHAEELAMKKKEIKDRNTEMAYNKINKKKLDKKAEDERLAKELKEIRLNRQYMNANAAMVEEKAWKELESGAERQIRNNQNSKLIDQCGLNAIAVKDQSLIAKNKKDDVTFKLHGDEAYEEKLEIRKKENEILHKNTLKSH